MPPCPRPHVQMLPWAAALIHSVSDPGPNGITNSPRAASENTGLYVLSSSPDDLWGGGVAYMCVQGVGRF